ncbi:high-affinity iron transporter [Rhizobium sp. BK529]|uniref:FTR1 family iron permease n=1 Tax=unclassified Rhizobium TaxID=2613769 RepID=UPI001046AFD8|nr:MULTISPECIES: FTR1 family protein [unclassified Rhizobium]MBB3593780.1 high-affinity iron transporter [Rhizobium sp. BK529]TCR96001.1 high-affinity iron transporter [Rhizobium sp. BK418]
MNTDLTLQTFKIASVVWRESFEALLVIGILLTWSTRAAPATGRRATSWILAGAGAGIALALTLALVLGTTAGLLEGDGEDILQMIMAALAAVLMLRMVFWMRRMARGESADLANCAVRHVKSGNWLGLSVIAALAVAREGAETVVFLFGLAASSQGWRAGFFVASGVVGLVLAAISFWAFKTGSKLISRIVLARISEVLLLLLGSGLTMLVIDKLISVGFFSPMTQPLWDTSLLLDDGSGFGAFLAGLVGYRARPELLPLLGLGFYWLIASLAYAPPLKGKALA